jgi:DNA-binding transcriptional regulator YiaG
VANFASVLKSEISRIARKEARQLVASMQKRLASARQELSASRRERSELARRVTELERVLRSAKIAAPMPVPADQMVRFSPKGLVKHRQRLGLSAAEFGALVGASGQSVFNWEKGQSKPRQGQLSRIASVRSLGKREAQARLAALE